MQSVHLNDKLALLRTKHDLQVINQPKEAENMNTSTQTQTIKNFASPYNNDDNGLKLGSRSHRFDSRADRQSMKEFRARRRNRRDNKFDQD